MSSPMRSAVMRVSPSDSSTRSSGANKGPLAGDARCDEQQQLVDEARTQERLRERRAAFEQQRLHSFVRERRGARPRATGAQLELGSVRKGPRPKASRRGCAHASTSRAVNCGSSARTVPMPTATASTCARSSCTRRRDSSPEIQREPGVATRPSSVTASFKVTNGRRSATQVRHASFCVRAASESAMLDLDTGSAQAHRARRAASGFGIERARDDLRDSGGEHRLRARRRRAVMRARLHRHVERRALCAVTGSVERDHLRVRPALALVPTLAHHFAVTNDDRADDRIRIGGAAASLRELERAFETHANSSSSRR